MFSIYLHDGNNIQFRSEVLVKGLSLCYLFVQFPDPCWRFLNETTIEIRNNDSTKGNDLCSHSDMLFKSTISAWI